MKLFKRLTVSGIDVPLVSEDIRLQLNTPSRAFFIISKPVDRGIIAFDMGYDKQKIYRCFFGYIETINKIDDNHYSVFCQEFGAVLNRRITTNLRHVTMKQVLNELAEKTKLQFIVPEQDYANTKTACFYSVGGGYHYMDSLKEVFKINQFIWQQQPDGKIYVGDWQHSRWKTRNISMPDKWLIEHGVMNSAKVIAIPNLRPGVFINQRGLVTKLTFKQNNMKITWSETFWNKPLKSW